MPSMLTIVKFPHELLTSPTEPVTVFDEKLAKLATNMHYTMRRSRGIGLAAPQIGQLIRLVVMDCSYMGNKPKFFVNPEIIYQSAEKWPMEEGCLSFPDTWVSVRRAEVIKVRYQNLTGEWREEEYTGLEARCLQHEIEHLNGILLINHAHEALQPTIYERLAQRKGLTV